MTTLLLEPETESPVEYPHRREVANGTLADLANSFDGVQETLRVEGGSNIVVSDDLSVITINNIEVPCNEESLDILAKWADFPKPFLHRLDSDLQSAWLNEIMRRQHQVALARIGSRGGLISVLGPEQIAFGPEMIVEVAQNVLGEHAPVVSRHLDPASFYLDVVTTPEVMRDLGDPQVGDITKAGLRFSLDVARNLAPTVNPYYYRLWCSNGASSIHEGMKMDARGLSVDEVMAELEVKARLAFGAVENEVAAMYELRNTIVAEPERTINRMARDYGVSDRMRLHLVDALPSLVDTSPGGQVTMFDLVQSATHLANSPLVKNRGQRLQLENFGGAVIASHVERCLACASKLN